MGELKGNSRILWEGHPVVFLNKFPQTTIEPLFNLKKSSMLIILKGTKFVIYLKKVNTIIYCMLYIGIGV